LTLVLLNRRFLLAALCASLPVVAFATTSASPVRAVGASTPALTLQLSASTVAAHGAVDFIAKVSGASGTATGTVAFTVDGAAYASGVPLSGGLANLHTTSLKVGFHSVTAIYSGDATYSALSSGSKSVVVVPTSASAYHPLRAVRVLDTRATSRTGYSGAKPSALQTITVQIRGRGGVPTRNVTAVVLKVAALQSAGTSSITAWSGVGSRPVYASLNTAINGEIATNMVVVPVAANGTIKLYTRVSTHLLADVQGYFAPSLATSSGRFVATTPQRLLETRSTATIHQSGYSGARPTAGKVITLRVTGRAGVPAGISAIVLNVTAIKSKAAGVVTVWPSQLSRPSASTFNTPGANRTVSSAVWVPVSPTGTVSVYVSQAMDVVADVAGWFTGSGSQPGVDGLFVPLGPHRVLDTRFNGPRIRYTGPKPAAQATVPVLTDLADLAGASSVLANVTATRTTASGVITMSPLGAARPNTTNISIEFAGQTRAALTTTKVGRNSRVSVYTQRSADLIVERLGYFLRDPGSSQFLDLVMSGATCGRTANGTSACWGKSVKQVKRAPFTSARAAREFPTALLSPSAIPGLLGVTQISSSIAGVSFGTQCAIANGGKGYCWGRNDSGQVGNGAPGPAGSSEVATPYELPGLSDVTYIDTGAFYTTCAIANGGELYCWGLNNFGQVGNGGADASTPFHVPGLHDVTGLQNDSYSTCAIANGGNLYCWGVNTAGQVGVGSTDISVPTPTQVPGIVNATALNPTSPKSGDVVSTRCAIANGGHVWCWGSNLYGSAGNGTRGDFLVDVPGGRYVNTVTTAHEVPGLTAADSVTVSRYYTTCATQTGELWCWGGNGWGQVSDGTTTDVVTPHKVTAVTGVRLASNTNPTCAVGGNGTGYCWGYGADGQMGDGTSELHNPTPTELPGLADIRSIVDYSGGLCAIANGGGLFCWGRNFFGQLGSGDTVDRYFPTHVPGLSDVTLVTAFNGSVCAIANGGFGYCWGANSSGQIGDGTTNSVLSPTQVQLSP
jgi:alpha-tubulin suppressor-like RCC1 family protein